jgi:hypothetical protein
MEKHQQAGGTCTWASVSPLNCRTTLILGRREYIIKHVQTTGKKPKKGLLLQYCFWRLAFCIFWRRAKEVTEAVALPALVNQLRRAGTVNHLQKTQKT